MGWSVVYNIDESFTEGDFKKVFFFLSISPFMAFFLVALFFIESPRLCLAAKKSEKAFKNIDKIGKRNNSL
jgi:hypothetical protein